MTPIEITPQVIAWSRENGTGKTENEKIADGISKLRAMQNGAEYARSRIRQAEVQHAETMKNLTEKLAIAQKACSHPIQKRHPDASGNNDSWDECLICGCEVGRDSYRRS